MLLLTFLKFVAAPFDVSLPDLSDEEDRAPEHASETAQGTESSDPLGWHCLSRSAPSRVEAPADLDRLSLTTREPGSKVNPDFGRWM